MKKIILLCLFIGLGLFLSVDPQRILAEGVASQVTGVLTEKSTSSSSETEGSNTVESSEAVTETEETDSSEDPKDEGVLPSTGEETSTLLLGVGAVFLLLGSVWLIRQKGERHDS